MHQHKHCLTFRYIVSIFMSVNRCVTSDSLTDLAFDWSKYSVFKQTWFNTPPPPPHPPKKKKKKRKEKKSLLLFFLFLICQWSGHELSRTIKNIYLQKALLHVIVATAGEPIVVSQSAVVLLLLVGTMQVKPT